MPVYHFTHQRKEHDYIDVEAPTEATARMIAREHLIGLYGQKAVDACPPLNLSCWNPGHDETRLVSTRLNDTQAQRVRVATLIRAAEDLEGWGTVPMANAAAELRQMAADMDRDETPNPDRKRIIECACGTRLIFRRHDDTAHDMEKNLSIVKCPTCGEPMPGSCPTEGEVVTARWTLRLLDEWDAYDRRDDACLPVTEPKHPRVGTLARDAACKIIGRLAAYKLEHPDAKVPA